MAVKKKSKKSKVVVPKPTVAEVNKYLKTWNSLAKYTAQESSLKKLFTVTYPNNNDLDEILIKVSSLNTFYSTHIYSPYEVADHILGLGIDTLLATNDLNVVNNIAKVTMNQSKVIDFYSFATKYCSHHKPTVYPIYDYYVEKVLLHFRRNDKFTKFLNKELKTYPDYKRILTDFCDYYKLTGFNLKQIDKYLWQLGKKCFPKDYKKKNPKPKGSSTLPVK